MKDQISAKLEKKKDDQELILFGRKLQDAERVSDQRFLGFPTLVVAFRSEVLSFRVAHLSLMPLSVTAGALASSQSSLGRHSAHRRGWQSVAAQCRITTVAAAGRAAFTARRRAAAAAAAATPGPPAVTSPHGTLQFVSVAVCLLRL